MKKVNGWWMQDGDDTFARLVYCMGKKHAGILYRDYYGSYKAALKFCRKHEVAIDCGAHVGTWSVEMAKSFKQVMAIEPLIDNYVCLAENIKQSNGSIVPFNAAVGEKSG